MIESLHIGAFRGLRDLSLDGLGRVNLLLGANNSGKSSILEALALWADASRLETWARVARMRSVWPLVGYSKTALRQDVEWLFPHQSAEQLDTIEIHTLGAHERKVSASATVIFGQPDWIRDEIDHPDVAEQYAAEQYATLVTLSVAELDEPRDVKFEIWQRGPRRARGNAALSSTPAVVVNAFSHRHAETLEVQWTQAIKAGLDAAVLSLVRAFDPAIEAIQILNEGESGARGLFVRHANRGFLPLDAFGDGVRRAIHFALSVIAARGGLLLIDEIEIAIHTSVIADVFDWLVDACIEHDVQLFATTHSLEAVDAIIGGRAGSSDDVVAWRLADGRLEKRIRGDLLRRLRFERGLEVRG